MTKFLVCAAILLATCSAWANPPSTVLSAENIFGFAYTRQSIDGGDSQSITSIAIGGSPLGQGGVYSVPRLGLDYVTASGFSVGGAVGVQVVSIKGGDSTTAVLLAPRVGYFTRVGSSVGLWPRGGINYWSGSEGGADVSFTALTLELPIEWFVLDSVALSITPHIDIGIAGGTDATDSKVTELGLHFGIATFL